MREEHLAPRDATRKAMDQITSPIIAISLVLAAVFIPSAMQSGSVGVIYKQFALTIAISMLFSAFLALSLTPALCATLLRPEHLKENRFFKLFNRGYEWSLSHYLTTVRFGLRHRAWWWAGFVVLFVGGFYVLIFRLPGSFVPDEDQGYTIGVVQMPPGSTIQRTREVMRRVGAKISRSPSVDGVFEVAGFSFSGSDESSGIFFIRMKEIKDRKETAAEFIASANANISGSERDGFVFFVNLPVITGLGDFGGFEMWLEIEATRARRHSSRRRTCRCRRPRRAGGAGCALQRPCPIAATRTQLDRAQAQSMGLAVDDVYNAIQLMLAPVYVNDFY
jgi:multidrug efflux pump